MNSMTTKEKQYLCMTMLASKIVEIDKHKQYFGFAKQYRHE